MDCNQIEDNYELYVLGALPEDERTDYESHLARCPEPHADFVEAAETMAAFAERLEPVPVPEGVALRLFARVDADLAARPLPVAPQMPSQLASKLAPQSRLAARNPARDAQSRPPDKSRGGPWRALIGARWAVPAMATGLTAIALMIAGGVWLDGRLETVEISAEALARTVENLVQQELAALEELREVDRRVGEVETEQLALAFAAEDESSTMTQVDELLAEVVKEQTELARQVQTVAAQESEIMDMVKEQRSLTYMASAPDSAVNMLWSSQSSPSSGRSATARGMMFMSNDGRIGLLAVLDLPPLPPDRVYQIWLIKNGVKTSVGIFTVDSSGYGQVVLQLVVPVGEFDAIGITVEPAGGSTGPTDDSVLVGDL